MSDFVSSQVMVFDQINPPFSKDIIPTNVGNSFALVEGYINPYKPAPTDLISFKFFFPRNGLPDGKDIFDQKGGEVFNIPQTSYVMDSMYHEVTYEEFAPQPPASPIPTGEPIEYVPGPDFIPTSYSGTVTITDPNHVKFDLTFTDGLESRRVESVFFFQTATFDQAIGECE
ncbi:MAG TPA: hypothetical protein DF383_01965 [Deltaproteobacteria bacterium]|nr:hypothetical protein [Deltaproteobacteria bacterium]